MAKTKTATNWKITQNTVTDKEKALQTALQGIEKQFGAMTVMRLGECKSMNIQSISTGLFTLDLALGVGGFPKGRIAEIYGPESSGKTTIALLAVAEAQKAGGICAFIDAEHALDPEYAKKLGVDTENLYVSQPDNGEQALKIAEELARSGAIALIVVDSVAALVPRAEIDGDMGTSHVGLQARLMSQGLRKLAGVVSKTGTVLIFINQLREIIGNNYGPSETTTGGRALKFYASVRLDIRRKDPIKGGKDSKEILGYQTQIRVVKNKVAPPFKTTVIDMMRDTGFDKVGAIVNLAIKRDLITKGGAWYTYQGKKVQGLPGVCGFFAENSNLFEELKKQLSQQTLISEPVEDDSVHTETTYEAEAEPEKDNVSTGDEEISPDADDWFSIS